MTTPLTGSFAQRPRLEVYVDDIRVPRITSVRITRSLRTKVSLCQIVLPNPVPDVVRMGSRVVIQGGTSRFVARFTGYLTTPGTEIWPGRLTFQCGDVLSNAEWFYPLNDVDFTGLTDTAIIQATLLEAGYPASKLHIQGQGTIPFPSGGPTTIWPAQESALEVCEEVDRLTAGSWRPWAEPDGHIYRRSFNGLAILAPIMTYEEGRHFAQGSLSLERRDLKATIAALGQQIVNTLKSAPGVDTDLRTGVFWDRYREWDARRDESPYPSDSERTTAWLIGKIFDTVAHVSLTVWDDTPFTFGSTFRVVAPRSRTDLLVWTQSVDLQLDSNSRWRMQLGGISLLDETVTLPILPPVDDSNPAPTITPIPIPGTVPPGIGGGFPGGLPPVVPPTPVLLPPAPLPAPPPPEAVPPGTVGGTGGDDGGDGGALPPAVTASIEVVALERELIVVTEIVEEVEVTHEVELFVIRVKNTSTSTGGTVVTVTWSTTGDASVAGYGPATLPDGLYFTTAFRVLSGSQIHLLAEDSTGLTGTATVEMASPGVTTIKRKIFALTETEVEEFNGTDWAVQTPTTAPVSQSVGGPVWGTGADVVILSDDELATLPTELPTGLGGAVPVVFNDDGETLIVALDPAGASAISTDSGTTWATGDPLPGVPAYLFSDGSVLRAATSEGLFSSSDNGMSWSEVRVGSFEMWAIGSIRHIVLKTDGTAATESGTALTGASGLAAVGVDRITDELFAVGTDGTGYKTEPGGNAFTAQPGTIPAGVELRGMLQDPAISRLFYLACGSGGIYKTIDGFATEGGVMQMRKPGIGNSPADANYLALGVGDTAIGGGDFTWIAASSTSQFIRLRDDGSGEAISGFAQRIVAGPQQSDDLFSDLSLSFSAFAHSSDQGVSWSGIADPSSATGESIRSGIAAGAAGVGYCMTLIPGATFSDDREARLYKTANGGSSWSILESVVIRPLFSVLTGFDLIGLDLWANAASVWWPIRQVTGTSTILSLLRRTGAGGGDADYALSGTTVTGVKPNHDNTDSALAATDANVYLLTGGSASAIGTFDGFDLWGSAIYATTGSSIRKSTNSGGSWTTIATLTEALGSIQFSESDQNRLIVCASTSNNFWVTTDAGATWTPHTIADWLDYQVVNTLVVF